MSAHKNQTGLSLHALNAFTFPDASTRALGTGYTLTVADIGKVALQSDTSRYYLLTNHSPITWSEISAPTGGGAGVNYISNPNSEDNTAGWSAYADAASALPVDGTGGSPNVTITRTTSNPLRNSASFLVTKDAANRQGQGVSIPFTIDRADLTKILSIEFDYEALAGWVAGSPSTDSDLEVYIYDVTNSVVIQPAPFKLTTAATFQGTFKGYFQAAANSQSYRLILHVPTTNASAWTFKFDNVRVGPETEIVENELIAASFDGTDNFSIANATDRAIGQVGTLLFDTHGAFNAGDFTCPGSGIYRVTAGCALSELAANGKAMSLKFRKNTITIHSVADFMDGGTSSSNEAASASGSVLIKAIAGDVLSVVVYQDNAASAGRAMRTNIGSGHVKLQFVQFERVG